MLARKKSLVWPRAKNRHHRIKIQDGLLPIGTILLGMMEEILPMRGVWQDLVGPKKGGIFGRCWKVKRVSAESQIPELLGEIKQWSQCCFGLLFGISCIQIQFNNRMAATCSDHTHPPPHFTMQPQGPGYWPLPPNPVELWWARHSPSVCQGWWMKLSGSCSSYKQITSKDAGFKVPLPKRPPQETSFRWTTEVVLPVWWLCSLTECVTSSPKAWGMQFQ